MNQILIQEASGYEFSIKGLTDDLVSLECVCPFLPLVNLNRKYLEACLSLGKIWKTKETIDMNKKQQIAQMILHHSIELLKPIANNITMERAEQKKVVATVAEALGCVVLMDVVEMDTELASLEDMQQQLIYIIKLVK